MSPLKEFTDPARLVSLSPVPESRAPDHKTFSLQPRWRNKHNGPTWRSQTVGWLRQGQHFFGPACSTGTLSWGRWRRGWLGTWMRIRIFYWQHFNQIPQTIVVGALRFVHRSLSFDLPSKSFSDFQSLLLLENVLLSQSSHFVLTFSAFKIELSSVSSLYTWRPLLNI